MKRVLITGGTGLVGSRLSELLTEKGYEVAHLSRTAHAANSNYKTYQWDLKMGFIEDEAITSSDYIIHLAGASLTDGWWTDERKKAILESRTKSADLLIDKLEALKHPLKAFVSASAVGFYGNRGDNLMQEQDEPGKGFLSEVCEAWERSVQPVTRLGIRLVINRIGVVLSTKGGALIQMEKPLKFGMGTYLGNGRQYYSWIHIDDLCRIFIKSIEDDSMKGVYNAVSPNPVRNKDLVDALEKVLDKPAITAPTPSILLRFLLGEMASIVLDSTKVSSDKIEEKGFVFDHAWLEEALTDLHKRGI